ncbi:hypothetical protein [Gryllotalpicola protaetiae]|uniref:Glycoside hydrolase family 65 n=1 Tax=Gryllotalpicola protaetiae TaxID=2419771 RepID=A0A387BJR9_9MICO|nr:hypothetical protein [Gryllotalpicola protaetiae]AYG02502.1 hypothetical protein D7I44_02480 [Gryllotalpicola protaetiae]
MINRTELVGRHSVLLDQLVPDSPLSVGNGEFCVTVDVTGLQTFPEAYPVAARYGDAPGTLLGTMSHWGWDSSPGRVPLEPQLRTYDSPHGPALYADLGGSFGADASAGQSREEEWLRNNPHRLDLGRVGLWAGDEPVQASALSHVAQRLELLTGTITSRFRLGDRAFATRTAVHPVRDALAVSIDGTGEVGLRLAFPAGSEAWANAADWSRPEAHTSELEETDAGWRVRRRLHEFSYSVSITAPGARFERVGTHEFLLRAAGGRLEAVVEFHRGEAGEANGQLQASLVFAAAAAHWDRFWNSGGALELADSDDPRAFELERRVVLSQYLSALSAGSLPPAETGLMLNSWRGKFHLEMHWWHHGWLPQWGRPELLERSLAWYPTVLGRARETARGQGLPGARWPKQIGPDGIEAPSPIGPFLAWQQPHPIHLAELLYRAAPSREVIERWADVVVATAEFMAAFPTPGAGGFELGPPIIPAQESYDAGRATNRNPTFELAYWSWALEVAAQWLERLGRTPPPRWREVSRGMAPPPVLETGTYAALGSPPYLMRTDHPSMLAALGVVPQTALVDRATMRRTLRDALADWDWPTAWGWDFPMAAMTATRLGEPELAVDALLLDVPKNTYLRNGHNRQDASLPIYLPGNGGLLLATGLMAAGHDGSAPRPGFGAGWHPVWEGITPLP